MRRPRTESMGNSGATHLQFLLSGGRLHRFDRGASEGGAWRGERGEPRPPAPCRSPAAPGQTPLRAGDRRTTVAVSTGAVTRTADHERTSSRRRVLVRRARATPAGGQTRGRVQERTTNLVLRVGLLGQ